ncbi:5'-methylthioadenosine/adenosylhomocysteine nucleosidase [Flavobacteriaceae bacterium]|nr:5'-methylthioadenosine/adenosylhomocysteine nucleosidase [Flavobacteriaceae bacterium]
MIGIISAMHDELAELLAVLKNRQESLIGDRTYYTGTIGKKEVVIVFSKWGKVAAAITTTQLISTYEPTEIIFSGVAGAISSDLNIGDIVIGSSLIQHDMDATPLFDKFEIPLIGKKEINTAVNTKLETCITEFQDNYFSFILTDEAKEFNINTIKVTKGLIASGDEFINSEQKIAALKTDLPELLCVEMEGAAVAQVCNEYKITFNIIRIISDKANDNAPLDFPKFTKLVASKYAKGILENYCS